MKKLSLLSLMLSGSLAVAAVPQEESALKFAFYSPAWGENTDDDLRLLAHNQTDSSVRLDSIVFLKDNAVGAAVSLDLGLSVPAGGYAEMELDYVDLLENDECVARTMAENWKLAEISNYTLNPSVRNLIIEDTDSFRIYQCVESVLTSWTILNTGSKQQKEEWVLYHFESRQD